jgi:hypothetical protein
LFTAFSESRVKTAASVGVNRASSDVRMEHL